MAEVNDKNAIPWRVGALEREVDLLWDRKADVEAFREHVKAEAETLKLTSDRLDKRIDDKADGTIVGDLRDEVRSLRKALVGFSLSVVVSAIGFAFAVFMLLGHHP